MMTLTDFYHEQCRSGQIQKDSQQIEILQHLEKLCQQIKQEQLKRSSLLSFVRKPRRIPGLYLWGGVGVGKTFLMDCFYHSLPLVKKRRLHFHSFMHWVQAKLKEHQGNMNPLQVIADELAQEIMVLCFDEFFVTDIADAMILGRLFEALFSAGICLVATSNVPPDELYINGLQRQHFLPTIALLKKEMHVVHLMGQMDYRLRHLEHAGVFYIPNDELAADNMEKSFTLLSTKQTLSSEPIEILGRSIPVVKRAEQLIWFDFAVICGIPRSQGDYLALVSHFKTFFISDLPILSAHSRDRISLWIKLIDVLYDARCRLVLSAEAPLEDIYSQGRFTFEYARTLSRLCEMQSKDYFSN